MNRPIDDALITSSYALLELLNVLAHAVRHSDQIASDEAGAMSRSMAYVVEYIAKRLASEIHDVLESNQVDRGGGVDFQTDLEGVDALISAHQNARAEHDRLFLADDREVNDAVSKIDDALIALCNARPSTEQGRRRRRQYLETELYTSIEGCEGLTKAVLNALLVEGKASP